MNSFSRAEESALRGITQPLHITVHLAAQDPRRMDLERRVLPKLRRALPQLTVEYVAATSTGLFEQSDPRYGELDYSLNGKSTVTRAVTTEGVLETIFTLAGTSPTGAEEPYRGYPLAAPPRFASILYYLFWPLLVLALALIYSRRNS
jgi:ABC-2 type transport system permease protein